MNELCKYTGITGSHDEVILVCRKCHSECVKLYPCAFFIAYHKEIF